VVIGQPSRRTGRFLDPRKVTRNHTTNLRKFATRHGSVRGMFEEWQANSKDRLKCRVIAMGILARSTWARLSEPACTRLMAGRSGETIQIEGSRAI